MQKYHAYHQTMFTCVHKVFMTCTKMFLTKAIVDGPPEERSLQVLDELMKTTQPYLLTAKEVKKLCDRDTLRRQNPGKYLHPNLLRSRRLTPVVHGMLKKSIKEYSEPGKLYDEGFSLEYRYSSIGSLSKPIAWNLKWNFVNRRWEMTHLQETYYLKAKNDTQFLIIKDRSGARKIFNFQQTTIVAPSRYVSTTFGPRRRRRRNKRQRTTIVAPSRSGRMKKRQRRMHLKW